MDLWLVGVEGHGGIGFEVDEIVAVAAVAVVVRQDCAGIDDVAE